MKIGEKKFEKRGINWQHSAVRKGAVVDKWAMCSEALDDIFDIPEETETIWLLLHTRPALNRGKVDIRMFPMSDDKDYPEICVPRSETESGQRYDTNFKMVDRLLEPFVGKSLYVQCEYQ